MSTKRVSKVEESSQLIIQEDPDTGEQFIELPYRLLKQLGWREGDTLQWIERPDGSWTVQKADEEENEDE
jgi:bifunctional DNA-binding transcriptional regulator/antitoxin component of YhaV-PrlF toxin-antitoxin module